MPTINVSGLREPDDLSTLRPDELEQVRNDLIAEAETLTRGDLTGADLARFEQIEALLTAAADRRDRLRRLHEFAARGESGSEPDANGLRAESAAGGRRHVTRTDPYEQPTQPESAAEVRSRALAAVERWNADDELKERATATLERLHDPSEGPSDIRGVSQHLLRYSSPLYVSAFRKFARDPEGYAADLTPDERRTWQEAREYQRATLQTSGAVLPSPLDPTIVLTNDGDVDPMRSVARVDTTVAKSKRYITSAGSSFSFDDELAEVSDDTFTEAEVQVDTEKAQGWIEASIEVWQDQPGFDSEVAKIIGDGKARLEAAKFVTGAAASDEPVGIITALTGGASEVDAAGETIAADDVYGLVEALPPRFRQNAVWQLEFSTINHLHRLHNPSGDEPPLVVGSQLVNRRFVENSSLDPFSDIDASATDTHRPLVVGDWRNYVILDRVGLSVHFIPPGVLRGSSDRPDGRVGWYAYWRTGAKPLTIAAFRLLKVTTTA